MRSPLCIACNQRWESFTIRQSRLKSLVFENLVSSCTIYQRGLQRRSGCGDYVGKKTPQIVWQNILMALIVKGIFLLLGAFGLASMWEAVFADVGVALAAIANATRVLR